MKDLSLRRLKPFPRHRGHLEPPFTGLPPNPLQNFSSYASRPMQRSNKIRPIPEPLPHQDHRGLGDTTNEITHDDDPWGGRRTPPPRPQTAWAEALNRSGMGSSASRATPRHGQGVGARLIPESPAVPSGLGENPATLTMTQILQMSHKDLVARLVQEQTLRVNAQRMLKTYSQVYAGHASAHTTRYSPEILPPHRFAAPGRVCMARFVDLARF